MSKHRELPPMHPASAMDFLPPAQLREVQFTRLRDMVQRAYDRVALFRKPWRSASSSLLTCARWTTS